MSVCVHMFVCVCVSVPNCKGREGYLLNLMLGIQRKRIFIGRKVNFIDFQRVSTRKQCVSITKTHVFIDFQRVSTCKHA